MDITPYRGDQYLFQSLNNLNSTLAGAIEAHGQRQKQLRATHSLLTALGVDKDQVDKMTPEDAQGMLQAMAVKKTLGELGLNEAQTAQLWDTINQRRSEVKAGETFRNVLSKYASNARDVNAGDLNFSNLLNPAGTPPVPGTPAPADIFSLATQSGMDPERAATIAGSLARVSGRSPEDFAFNPGQDISAIPGIGTFIRTSKGGGEVVESPEAAKAKAEAVASAKTPPSGVRFKAVPSLTDPSGWATSVEADSPEALQQGLALLKQGANPGAPAAAPRTFTDKSGARWAYKGSQADPTKDTNPDNWTPMTGTQ